MLTIIRTAAYHVGYKLGSAVYIINSGTLLQIYTRCLCMSHFRLHTSCNVNNGVWWRLLKNIQIGHIFSIFHFRDFCSINWYQLMPFVPHLKYEKFLDKVVGKGKGVFGRGTCTYRSPFTVPDYCYNGIFQLKVVIHKGLQSTVFTF